MKLKYYLRGAGLGIIFATLIMILACSIHNYNLSDDEIMKRAAKLGMIMPESETNKGTIKDSQKESEKETGKTSEAESQPEQEEAQPTVTEDTPPETESHITPPVATEPQDVTITITSGMEAWDVAKMLFLNGLVADAEAFRSYMGTTGISETLQIGSYTIPAGATEDQIIEILRNGNREN